MFKSAISFAVVALLLAAAPAGATDARRNSTVLPEPQPFEQTLTLLGVGFRVTSANQASANEVTIVPTGLSIDNAPIVRRVEGQVERAEVADLDRDGSPEIYVYLRSAAAGAHGSLLAFSANRRKSLSDIYLAPLADHAKASKGYRGQDEFAVVKHRLVRRFPVYKEGDTPGAPSGGTRRLEYRLTKGEASWVLELDRVLAH